MDVCSGSYFAEGTTFHPCTSFGGKLFEEGFSVYEVIRIVSGKCLFLGDHLGRLSQSVDLSGNNYDFNIESLSGNVRELITRNNKSNGNIKIIINFRSPDTEPVVYMFFIPHYYPSVNEYQNGVPVTLTKFVRNDPNIKKMGNTSLSEAGVYETLLVDENDHITEGSKTNVFFISGNNIYTAPDEIVLKGVTRHKVLEILKKLSITFFLQPVSVNDLQNMDSVFLTGTSPKVLPVRNIDSLEFNVANSCLRKVMNEYNQLVNNYLCDTI